MMMTAARATLSAGEVLVVDTREARLRRMRSAVLTRCRLTSEALQLRSERYRAALVTLTYAEVGTWQPDDIRAFLRRLKDWASRRGAQLPYVWVAELQQRGAVHYHVMLFLPRGLTLPKPDKQGWWKLGSSRIEWARRAVGYLAKYASKSASKSGANFPRGLRLYGSGCLDASVVLASRWWALPGFLRSGSSPAHDFRRAPGGGFLSRALGFFVASPWRRVSAGSRTVRLVLVGDPCPVIPPLAYSGIL